MRFMIGEFVKCAENLMRIVSLPVCPDRRRRSAPRQARPARVPTRCGVVPPMSRRPWISTPGTAGGLLLQDFRHWRRCSQTWFVALRRAGWHMPERVSTVGWLDTSSEIANVLRAGAETGGDCLVGGHVRVPVGGPVGVPGECPPWRNSEA